MDVETFFVYPKPNPFSSGFNIIILTTSASSITVNIHDVLGRIVETYNDVTENTLMGVNLNKGIYFAEVIQNLPATTGAKAGQAGNSHRMIQLVKSE